MKNVLIITYYWPPSGGAGVQRWLKFAKYLHESGMQPIVVTVNSEKASYPVLDTELEKDISKGIRIFKTNSFEPLKLFNTLFKKEHIPYAGIPDRKNMTLLGKVSLFMRANLLIPDARKGWNPYAYRQCCKIIESEKIDCIITTSPPHSTQLIGLELKKKYGIKWLVDLRDPWTDIYYYKKLHHSNWAMKKDKQYEQEVLAAADIITTTSSHTQKLFSGKLTGKDVSKIKIITNGYDEDDLKSITGVKEKNFTITFSGTINKQFGVSGFLNAMQELIKENKQVNLNIRFVGITDEFIKNEAQALLGNSVSFISYVPHKTAIGYCCSSHLLLLVIPEGENQGTIPGKTFEYMATRNPILCLSPANGSASEIILNANAGKSFGHQDVKGIKEFVLSYYKKWEQGEKFETNNDNLRSFSRREITNSLIAILNSEH